MKKIALVTNFIYFISKISPNNSSGSFLL